MVDISKIKVGDEVTVKAIVKEVTVRGNIKFDVKAFGSAAIAFPSDIVTHTPKPREFKPGDEVRFRDEWTTSLFRVVYVKDEHAWIEKIGSSVEWRGLVLTKELRHADESE